MKKVLASVLVMVLIVGSLSFALTYPVRPVKIICPWSAGGGTDMLTRFMASQLQKEFNGNPFLVVNRTGGGGAIGHMAGAMARPDGYTVTMITLELSTMHWMGLTTVNYKNFSYIIQLNQDPAAVIVRADAPWHSITQLLVSVAMHPGKYKFSGSGAGSIWDLAMIGMLKAAGIPPSYGLWIPTTGAAPSLVELLGGHIDAITCSIPEALTQIEAGKLRVLAIMSDKRDPMFPNVPTLKEMGVDWSAGTWRGLAAPKNTPKEIVDLLYKKSLAITKSDAFIKFMKKMGFGVRIRNPKEFYNFVKEQDATWKSTLKAGGFMK